MTCRPREVPHRLFSQSKQATNTIEAKREAVTILNASCGQAGALRCVLAATPTGRRHHDLTYPLSFLQFFNLPRRLAPDLLCPGAVWTRILQGENSHPRDQFQQRRRLRYARSHRREAFERPPSPQLRHHRPQHAGCRWHVAAKPLQRGTKKDGTTIGLVRNNTPFEPLMGTKEAEYDVSETNKLPGRRASRSQSVLAVCTRPR